MITFDYAKASIEILSREHSKEFLLGFLWCCYLDNLSTQEYNELKSYIEFIYSEVVL